MKRMILALVATTLLFSASDTRAGRDQLVIGMTQFPSTFSPIINSMLAKSYVLAMTRRPFVIYDRDWELACLLCVELPTIENGLARVETLGRRRGGDQRRRGVQLGGRQAPGNRGCRP
jgi:peptide/nickel transport system substrate-binding protein